MAYECVDQDVIEGADGFFKIRKFKSQEAWTGVGAPPSTFYAIELSKYTYAIK